MRGTSIEIDVEVQSMELKPGINKDTISSTQGARHMAAVLTKFPHLQGLDMPNINLTDSVRNAVGVVADRSVFLNQDGRGPEWVYPSACCGLGGLFP